MPIIFLIAGFIGLLARFAGSSVLPLVEYDAKGDSHVRCTAIVVSKQPARLLSASHCFKEPDGPQRVDGRTFRVVRTSGDLALLEPDEFYSHWRVLPLGPTTVPDGTIIAAMGYPLGGPGPRVTHGWVAGEDAEAIYLDLQLVAGMSGGPILNKDGQLVSIVNSCEGDGQNTICSGPTPAAIHAFLGEGK